MRPYADLFLLGAGFMLLETKSITGFALLFGTTWVVNAIVFAGVLVAVLAAVEVTRRFKTPPAKIMYAILFGGLALAWVFPDEWLLGMPVGLRAVVAVLIAFLPIFAANVIFAKRFTDTADGTASFGANLLGAMLGGCLEYAALDHRLRRPPHRRRLALPRRLPPHSQDPPGGAELAMSGRAERRWRGRRRWCVASPMVECLAERVLVAREPRGVKVSCAW